MVFFTWLWWTVRRADSPEYHDATAVYLSTMLLATGVMVVSAYVHNPLRTWLWAAYSAAWIIGVLAMRRVATQRIMGVAVSATESLVERMDLFVIIVLGEVVVGVVNGLGASPASVPYIITALTGMLVAFGIWWMYFDFAGQRTPAREHYTRWVLAHLPLTFGIAAVGGCMVNLVHRAPDAHTPPVTAWVTATSFSIAVAALVATYVTLEDARRHRHLYRKLVAGAALVIPVALLVGAAHPRPAAMLGTLALLLTGLWWLSVLVWVRSDTPVRSWPPGLGDTD